MGERSTTDDFGPWATRSRRRLTRHLIGTGLEIGPGHVPFPTRPETRIVVVDRFDPDQNEAAYPMLAGEQFTPPGIVAELDTQRLCMVADQSQDFVICSHVLEHVVEPIGLLSDLHRVLRPGGLLLLVLPDRHRTLDRYREGTPVEHLVAEHEAGVTELDDDHLVEFLTNVAIESPSDPTTFTRGLPTGATPEEREWIFDTNRRLSIHAHCWDEDEFEPVLHYGIAHLGWRWELVDAMVAADEGVIGMEFGFLLQRGIADIPDAVAAQHFADSWQAWRDFHDEELPPRHRG